MEPLFLAIFLSAVGVLDTLFVFYVVQSTDSSDESLRKTTRQSAAVTSYMKYFHEWKRSVGSKFFFDADLRLRSFDNRHLLWLWLFHLTEAIVHADKAVRVDLFSFLNVLACYSVNCLDSASLRTSANCGRAHSASLGPLRSLSSRFKWYILVQSCVCWLCYTNTQPYFMLS